MEDGGGIGQNASPQITNQEGIRMFREKKDRIKWETRRAKMPRRLQEKVSSRQIKLQRLLEEEEFAELEY